MSRRPTTSARAGDQGWALYLMLAAALLLSGTLILFVFFSPVSAEETAAVAQSTASGEPAPSVPTTQATVAPGPWVDYSDDELEFVRLLNEYRQTKGLEPLLLSDQLTVACDRHTSDMATYDFLDHYTGHARTSSGRDRPLDGTRSDYFATGTDPAERMVACGYDYQTSMGENIAAGQSTAASALRALRASPTHDANLVSPDFKVLGIALIHRSGSDWGYYWTVDFGGYVDHTARVPATVVAAAD